MHLPWKQRWKEGAGPWGPLSFSTFHRVHAGGAGCSLGIPHLELEVEILYFSVYKSSFSHKCCKACKLCSSQMVSVLYLSFTITLPWCSIDYNKFCCSHFFHLYLPNKEKKEKGVTCQNLLWAGHTDCPWIAVKFCRPECKICISLNLRALLWKIAWSVCLSVLIFLSEWPTLAEMLPIRER